MFLHWDKNYGNIQDGGWTLKKKAGNDRMKAEQKMENFWGMVEALINCGESFATFRLWKNCNSKTFISEIGMTLLSE